MPTTRKKVIKTVYKDDDSEGEVGAGDFSDSGSDAQISEAHSSSDEEIEENVSSAEEFDRNTTKKRLKQPVKRKPKFAKQFIGKINKQSAEIEESEIPLALFSVKNLTDSDKLLPSVLNLSESDSSDDEAPKVKKTPAAIPYTIQEQDESDTECHNAEYSDVWGKNIHDNSAEIAKKTFMELEQHKNTVEETKASLQNYVPRTSIEVEKESNVTDLLALGEEVAPKKSPAKKKGRSRKAKGGSDSELEDWEEVKESKPIPQQGLQLVVELPDHVYRKSKKIDVEMMMKRKINRVKKEHQVFMHKVHVLSWIGHGNYVNCALNDQEVMAAVLAMVPKGCYPEDRLNMKYVEQIVTWYTDKLTLKQDKNEHKFKPKAPPLKNILLDQIKSKTLKARKYSVFIFVAMLRALGLQCRVMFNFVTVPLKPSFSELCSLATKPKDEKSTSINKTEEKVKPAKPKANRSKKLNKKLPQIDGVDDNFMSSDSEFEDIMQVDGNDDTLPRTKSVRSTRAKKVEVINENEIKEEEDVSPPKRSKKGTESAAKATKKISTKNIQSTKSTQINNSKQGKEETVNESDSNNEEKLVHIKSPRSLSLKKVPNDDNKLADDEKNKSLQKSAIPRKGRSNSKTTAQENTIIEPSKTEIPIQGTKKPIKTSTSLQKKNKSSKTVVESTLINDTTNTEPKKLAIDEIDKLSQKTASPRKTRSNSKSATDGNKKTTSKNDKLITEGKKISSSTKNNEASSKGDNKTTESKRKLEPPEILVTDETNTQSKYFETSESNQQKDKISVPRKRSRTAVNETQKSEAKHNDAKAKTRTKSAPGSALEKSKYFDNSDTEAKKPKLSAQQLKKQEKLEDAQRVSHRDITKTKVKPKNDVTDDLVNILKGRIKVAKEDAKKGIVKGKIKEELSDDSDYLPVENKKCHNSEDSDEDFKPMKISPRAPKLSPGVKPSTSKKHIDRRVLSSDDEATKSKKVDVWCEVFVEELEQWIAVDVIKGKVHSTGDLYSHATHPVCYIIGWDNNNFLKDLTRRYVPHWNTVTRKQRAETDWWNAAVKPWLGPKNARDREEDEALDRMQLEAPLPKSIAEYKNHPLYALKRHLLKFEAIYPEDAATLGFVRNEAVYARECVYTCRSRDTWLKEAKVVKFGERPYKVVKARPKWDKLSNKLITDKPLEVFGPWQVQDYEPPTAENGLVPRNAYGNVELFKDCMLPKGTVHIKLPGLNKVARKLNIDCAPAMTGFDFNGGWSHPVYDGFVVCKEFEEIITDAWVKDQEEQERREREKIELRVYGNWKRLIKGLLIRERLKLKYGFEEPSTSQAKSKKGPRLVVKKK